MELILNHGPFGRKFRTTVGRGVHPVTDQGGRELSVGDIADEPGTSARRVSNAAQDHGHVSFVVAGCDGLAMEDRADQGRTDGQVQYELDVGVGASSPRAMAFRDGSIMVRSG
jgi:hypothetical protein